MSVESVHIRGLSKGYRLGVISTSTLHEDLSRWWARRRGRPDPLFKVDETAQASDSTEFIWALKNVTLSVGQGEVLGIIGRNGAGKSTLLKILSRVTAPTEGFVGIRGRIASLLEVGTGFHPELTGRQNTYLNGSILGMSRREVARKFDEIVDFAGVERFIDTPVKRYSSGMYVRLAFAVAAHLEPEVLLVDEVLSVGDVEFQRKCLGKMGSVAREGRTILFVSHNLAAIWSLCSRVCWLDAGVVVADGATKDVVSGYEASLTGLTVGGSGYQRLPGDVGGKSAWIESVSLTDEAGAETVAVGWGSTLVIDIALGGQAPSDNFIVEFVLHNVKGELVSYGGSQMSSVRIPSDCRDVRLALGPLPLTAGTYFLSFGLRDTTSGPHWDWWDRGVQFSVGECDPTGCGFLLEAINFGATFIAQGWEPR